MLFERSKIKRKTQYDIHILTGIHQSRLSLIENGLVIPSEKEKAKIETALNTRIDWDKNRCQKLREIAQNKKEG